MRGLLSLISLLVALNLQAQEYRFHQYRVEQGLPSDVIKAVTEDSLGFFWIATDDGLVKYDGIKFTSYKNALRNQFAKGFIHTAGGKLLVFSDLDLVEIENRIDTVIFTPVIRGERFLTDSTMSYPKSIYQDKRAVLWMGEPKSVLRYDGHSLKRYEFSEKHRSPVFVRSFSLFEDSDGNLFAVSYNGHVFRYDPAKDEFKEQEDFQLPGDVSHVLYIDGQLLIASRFGLYKASVRKGLLTTPENIFPVTGVSHLRQTADSSIIVSTYGEDLYRVSLKNGFRWESIYFNFNGINSSYYSREGDIWVSTDKGLVVVQQNSFTTADPNSRGQFIEGITNDAEGNIYFATKETLVQLSLNEDGEWKRKELMRENANYFQSLEFSESGLWAATNWRVILLKGREVLKSYDFSGEGNFVHHLFLDSRKRLWLSQAGSKRIKCILPSFEVTSYPVEGLGQSEINHIEEGSDGLYAVANGADSYLFFKSDQDSVFRNISIPVTFNVRGDFNVLTMAIQGNDIWLASSEGLLKFDRQTLERHNRGRDFERYPVSCIKILDSEQILFSNSFGLFRFNVRTGEYWLYDEDSGLPSNMITDHGIHVTNDSTIWIGTSYGIATTVRNLSEYKKTRIPYCVEARVNGIPKRYVAGLDAAFNAYVTLQFSPVTFPENKIDYQWRIDKKEQWLDFDKGLLSLSDLPEGEHIVYVRAKKNTGLSWSDAASVTLNIDPPYWKKTEFVFLVMLLVVFISWASYAISSTLMNQRKRYLEEQINERTQELKKANEELTIRNTELDRFVYSASHDLSAPLKSILGLIRVAKLDKPGDIHRQYLDMMERSVFKLEDFIEEVVTYSRNTRMPLKYEPLDFTPFVQNLLQDHEYSPNFSAIDFIIEDETGEPMISDVTRMKIILNNLISNAIKFHLLEGNRKPFVKISLSRNDRVYNLMVADNGRGIPEEHLKRIFEMFYRATDEAQGSGLGLYILKEAVLKLSGSVEAHSVLDSGTEFMIHLPVPESSSGP